MSYGIILWGNLSHSSTVFSMGEGKKGRGEEVDR
jgi:hypothetical protein